MAEDNDIFIDAVWAHPKHKDSPEVLRFAEHRGLPLKFSMAVPEGSIYIIKGSELGLPVNLRDW